MNTRTFKIHESNRSEADSNIKALNKKFTKHNIPLISYSWSSEKDDFDCYEITVTYEDVPTISGVNYKYLGLISDEDGSKFYNGFDDETFKIIKNMNCTCEMCKKQINRNSFYVFKNIDNDEIKMFGSSCAKKAFPFDIGMYLNGLDMFFESMNEITENTDISEKGGCFGGKMYFDLDRVINSLRTVTNDFTCWISQEKAEAEYPRLMSTKEQVLDMLCRK